MDTRSTPIADDLVLGVDGGGSKTLAWLVDRSLAIGETGAIEPLGVGQAGPSNPRALGMETAGLAIAEAVARAFDDAGRSLTSVASACLALAGAGREPERLAVQHWAESRRLARRVLATHDAYAVLGAASPADEGVALIAGTGSMAFGRTSEGVQARSGGWGYLIGDEGGGYQLALNGLNAAAMAWDGRGPQTSMTERLLEWLKVNEPNAVLDWVYRIADDRGRLAELAKLVLEAADADDAVAVAIREEGAEQLALLVVNVSEQLGLRNHTLGMAGSLLTRVGSYRDRVVEVIRKADRAPARIVNVAEPVAGAVRLAFRALPESSKGDG